MLISIVLTKTTTEKCKKNKWLYYILCFIKSAKKECKIF